MLSYTWRPLIGPDTQFVHLYNILELKSTKTYATSPIPLSPLPSPSHASFFPSSLFLTHDSFYVVDRAYPSLIKSCHLASSFLHTPPPPKKKKIKKKRVRKTKGKGKKVPNSLLQKSQWWLIHRDRVEAFPIWRPIKALIEQPMNFCALVSIK